MRAIEQAQFFAAAIITSTIVRSGLHLIGENFQIAQRSLVGHNHLVLREIGDRRRFNAAVHVRHICPKQMRIVQRQRDRMVETLVQHHSLAVSIVVDAPNGVGVGFAPKHHLIVHVEHKTRGLRTLIHQNKVLAAIESGASDFLVASVK